MSTTLERPSIKDPIEAICEVLGLVPRNVASLHITPTKVIAEIHKTNDDGAKYIGDGGKAAKETLTFEVST